MNEGQYIPREDRPRFSSIAGTSEMRFFWLTLPFLIGGVVMSFAWLPPLYASLFTALFFVVTLGLFFTSYRASAVSMSTVVTDNELRSIVFGLEDALIAYDETFHILFFNPAAERLFDISAADVLGGIVTPQDTNVPEKKVLAQVVFPSLAPKVVARSQPGRYPQIVDISVQEPSLELRVATSPISKGDGSLMGFVKIIRNRSREVAMLQSKDEFIGVASHQLRTPITELTWALQAIGQDATLSGDTKNIVERAQHSAQYLLTIVNDLLNVSKMEDGKFGYEFTPTDIVVFVENVLVSLMPQVERIGLKLYFDKPKELLPAVPIDSTKLTMAITNLLDNAVRYNVEGGHITVRVARDTSGKFIELRIEDTGIGIPADQIANLFSKFFRGSNAIKSQADGSGLGLYIVKNIIEAHGGKIRVESEQNRGTVFVCTLPINPPPPAPGEELLL